jgi:hypothetical protein
MNAQIDQRPAGRHAFVRKPASALSIGLLRHLSCTMTYHSTLQLPERAGEIAFAFLSQRVQLNRNLS